MRDRKATRLEAGGVSQGAMAEIRWQNMVARTSMFVEMEESGWIQDMFQRVSYRT